MMPRYFRQSRGPKQGRGVPSQSAAVIWYAPVTPFDVMWLECGDEGIEKVIDDQNWGGRRAYQRRSIAKGAIVCVAGSSVTLRVAGRVCVVR